MTRPYYPRTYRIRRGSRRHPGAIAVARALVAALAVIWLLLLLVTATVAIWLVIALVLS